jgi:hypothetical protein
MICGQILEKVSSALNLKKRQLFGHGVGGMVYHFTRFDRTKNVMITSCRRGIVVIPSACRTEDPGSEFRQGLRFLGIYTLQSCCHNLIIIVCKINALKFFWKIITNKKAYDDLYFRETTKLYLLHTKSWPLPAVFAE